MGIEGILTAIEDVGAQIVLKVNARELCKLAEVETQSGSEVYFNTSEVTVTKAASKLFDKYRILN